MLHGFMGSSRDMLELADILSGKFYCLIPDLPGHGNSLFKKGNITLSGDFMSVPQMICDRLLSLGVKRYTLYGYSMGGRVAAGMAVLSPERIEKLVLESSSFGIEGKKEKDTRYKNDLALFDDIDIKKRNDFMEFLEKWYNLDIFKTLDKDLKRKLVIKRIGNHPEELRKAMKIMSTGNQPYLLNKLAQLNLNISYIYGIKDKKYREEAGRGKEKISGMKLFPIEGASHNVHLQFPKKVVSIIM